MTHAILPLHILAGVVALLAGYVALWASKGARLHRKSGLLFVFAMVILSLSGAWVAMLEGSSTSVVAGLLTFYFVTTALLTVRQRSAASAKFDVAAMLFAVAVAALAVKTGLELKSGRPEVIPMFIFGGLGLLAAAGDLRMIRAGGIAESSRRVTRHLWRMCFAMWVAAASFFWGPPGRVPEVIRIPALLAVPVLTPVVAMLYWLWRMRSQGHRQGPLTGLR